MSEEGLRQRFQRRTERQGRRVRATGRRRRRKKAEATYQGIRSAIDFSRLFGVRPKKAVMSPLQAPKRIDRRPPRNGGYSFVRSLPKFSFPRTGAPHTVEAEENLAASSFKSTTVSERSQQKHILYAMESEQKTRLIITGNTEAGAEWEKMHFRRHAAHTVSITTLRERGEAPSAPPNTAKERQ